MRLSKVWILTLCFGAFAWADGEIVIDNNQIKLTYNPSGAVVVPGHKTTLVIEIEPKPNIHLYAQGAKGYLAVDWQMEESKAWTSLPTVFPAPHIVNLLNENVPVFSNHIRLVRDLTLDAGTALESVLTADRMITVGGSFQFQACDDKLCYFPKTIPLKWTFNVGQPAPAPEKAQRKAR
jgi:hypothetical protein